MKEKCKKPGCTSEIRKDRMKDHLINVHGETSETSALLPGQLNIGSFFQRTEKPISDNLPSPLNDNQEFIECVQGEAQAFNGCVQSADQESEAFDTCLDFEVLEKSYENVEEEQSAVSLHTFL